MRLPLLFLVCLLPACDAKAPPVKEVRYIVRIAYVTDLEIRPSDTPRGCEVPRRFAEKELPEMPGYTKVVRCIAIGNE